MDVPEPAADPGRGQPPGRGGAFPGQPQVRGERPGAMFADWELIGVPHRVVLSERRLKNGEIEYQGRRDAAASAVPAVEAMAFLRSKLPA